MPTYEYKCADCETDLEVVQSIHDNSLTECPECGGSLRKQFGNVGVVFKGSGFYKTDSRSPEKKSPKPPKKSETTSETKTESKSDSKSSSTAGSSSSSSDTKKS